MAVRRVLPITASADATASQSGKQSRLTSFGVDAQCLVAVTGVSALALVPAEIRFGPSSWDDMTTDGQIMALWQLPHCGGRPGGPAVCATVVQAFFDLVGADHHNP